MSAEKLKLPNKVVNANWKDNVPGLDYVTYGTEEQEMEYISPNSVSDESIEKIKSIDLTQKFRGRGKNVYSVFKDEKMAA